MPDVFFPQLVAASSSSSSSACGSTSRPPPQGVPLENVGADKKLIAHVFCDGYLEKSSLVGRSFTNTTRDFLHLLSHVREKEYVTHSKLDEMIERYRKLLYFLEKIKSSFTATPTKETYDRIQGIAEEMGNAVFHLRVGEGITLPTGYSQKADGHSMLLDVKRKSSKLFTLTLYTTGEGLSYHPSIQTEGKKKNALKLEFEVSETTLFFSKEPPLSRCNLFFESLLSLLVIQQKRNFSVDFIYEYLFHHFYPNLQTTGKKLQFKKPQGDGTCSWKVLLKHLSYHLSEKKYWRAKFFIERDLLCSFYSKRTFEGDRESKNLLLTGAKRLYREAEFCLENKVISEDIARKAKEMVNQIGEEVKKYHLDEVKIVSSTEDPLLTSCHKQEFRQLSLDCVETIHSLSAISQKPPNPIGMVPRPPTTDFKIETLVTTIEKILNMESPEVQSYAIERLMRKISADRQSSCWQTLFFCDLRFDSDQDKLDALFSLFNRYFSNVQKQEGLVAREVNTLLALYMTIDQFARRIDNQDVFTEFAPFNLFLFLDQEPFLQFENQEELDRFEKLRGYFKAKEGQSPLPKMDSLEKLNDTTLEKSPLSHFLLKVIRTYPYVGLNKYEWHKNLHKVDTSENVTQIYFLLTGRASLYRSGTKHIYHWFSAYRKLHALLPQWLINEEKEDVTVPKGWIANDWAGYTFEYLEWKNFAKKERYERTFQSKELRPFFEDIYEKQKRADETDCSEAFILHKAGIGQRSLPLTPPDKALYWACSEQKLKPYHLLFYFTNRIELLDATSFQTKLWLLFFNSDAHRKEDPASGAASSSSSSQQANTEKGLLIDDPQLLDAVSNFIEKGLYNFHETQPDKSPNLPACLFFHRFAQQVAKWLPPFMEGEEYKRFACLLERIYTQQQEWANEPTFSSPNRALIHLHRLHHYWSRKEITEKDLPKIYASWCYYKNHIIDPERRLKFLEKSVETFIQDLLNHPKLRVDQNVLSALKEHVLEALNIKKDERTSSTSVILQRGEVFLNGVKWSLSVSDLLFTKNYKRLFGSTYFHFFKKESDIRYTYFNHPEHGEFRAYKDGADYHIQWHIKGKWHAHIERETFLKENHSFPLSKVVEHHHWMPVGAKGPLIISNAQFQEIATLNTRGILTPKNQNRIITRIPQSFELPKLIDRRDCQELIYDSKGNPIEWRVCRYTSIHGHRLAFLKKGDDWRWKENSHYVLSKSKKTNLLGPLPNYLYLTHEETNETLIFVPYQPVAPTTTTAFSPEGALSVDTESSPISLDEESILTYFTYKVGKDHHLNAESLEGALFQIYLNLHQGNYDFCLDQLAILSPVDTLSPIAQRVLNMLLSYPDTCPNCFPTTYALLLKIALRYWNHQRQETLDAPILPSQEQIHSFYERYQQYSRHINPKYQLLEEEKSQIASLLSDSLQDASIQYPPESLPPPFYYSQLSGLKGVHTESELLNERFCTDESFRHLRGFNFNERFFKEAWQVIHSSDLMAKQRIDFLLKYALGLQNYTPNSEILINTNQITAEFLLYLNRSQRFLKPSPKHFKSIYQWARAAIEYSSPLPTHLFPTFPTSKNSSSSSTTSTPQGKRLELTDNFYYPELHGIIETFFPNPQPRFESFKELPKAFELPLPKGSKYGPSLEEECRLVKEAIKKGRDHLKEMQIYSIPPEKVEQAVKKVEHHVSKAKKALDALEKDILSLSKAVPQEAQLMVELQRGGNRVSPIDMDLLSRLFLERSSAAFKKMNPYLGEEEIQVIFNLLGKWNYQALLYQTSHFIQGSLEKIRQIDRESGRDRQTQRDYLCQKIVAELRKIDQFPPEMAPELLTFARLSGKVPRQDQIEDVQRFSGPDGCLLQKMMGGGKTSVNAAIWGYLTASKGTLPILFIHSSQRFQVQENLKHSQRTCFNQEVFTIDYPREALTLDRLIYIRDELRGAIKKKKLLIMTPEMLDLFDLQCDLLLICCLGLDNNENSIIDKQHSMEKVGVLKEILDLFAKAEGLGDEVDLLKNVNHETNIPIGAVEHLPKERIALVQTIFSYLISGIPNVANPSAASSSTDHSPQLNLAQTLKHWQANLSKEEYLEEIVPKIAARLANEAFPSLIEKKHLHESFIRFVTKTMSPDIDRIYFQKEDHSNLSESKKRDVEFIAHIHELYQSPNAALKEEAKLISLAKHTLFDLIFPALKLSAGRDFGRWKDLGQPIKTPFKVIPYLGVDSPTLTELGYQYEELVKHFIVAIELSIEPEQVKFISEKASSLSRHQLRREGITPEKTADFQAFKKMTGLRPEEVKDPKKLAEATARVNSDPQKKLQIEGETAYGTFYPSRLTRRPLGLPKLLKKVSFMGGTPWNSDGYSPELLEKAVFDQATEGSILQVMIDRADETHIYTPTSMEVRAAFEAIYQKHPQTFINAIFDAGAYFRNNLKFAQTFQKFSKEKKLPFKGILFFYQPDSSKSVDQFAALINGFESPIHIHGTSSKDIEKATSLKIDDFFVFLSEKQTTGTDLEFAPNIRAVMTVDTKIDTRKEQQTALRERLFHLYQTLEFLVPQYAIPGLVHKEPTVAAILATGISNQSTAKTDSLDQSYHNQIDQVLKDLAREKREKALSQAISNEEKLVYLKPYYEVLNQWVQITIIDDPHLHFSGLEADVDYLMELQNYANSLMTSYEGALHKGKIKYGASDPIMGELTQDLQRVRVRLEKILDRARELHRKKLPQTTAVIKHPNPEYTSLASNQLGLSIHQERQVERKINMELETVLQRELKQYENMSTGSLAFESTWGDTAIIKLLELFLAGKETTKSLNQAFREFEGYKHDFAFFDDTIFATSSFLKTHAKTLPVFHPCQRPARQILVIAPPGEPPRYVLLSAKEGVTFKRFLERHYHTHESLLQNIHLIHLTKEPFTKNPFNELPTSKEFGRGIVLLNLFEGTLSWIHPEDFDHAVRWMGEGSSESIQEKEIYLKLRTERTPFEKVALHQSGLLVGKSGRHRYASLAQMYAGRHRVDPTFIPLIKDPTKLFHLGKNALAHIEPWQVPHIDPRRICYLEREELIQAVPVDRLARLTFEQIRFISGEQLRHFTHQPEALTEKLISRMVSEHFLKDQERAKGVFDKLTPKQIGWIRNPGAAPLIADVNLPFIHSDLVSAISADRYRHLSPKQIPFIPHENCVKLGDDQLDHLEDSQLKGIPNEALGSLIKRRPSLVEKTPTEKLGELWQQEIARDRIKPQLPQITDPKILGYLAKKEVNLIHPDLAPKIPDKLIRFVDKPELIQGISTEQVHLINPDFYGHLEDFQILFIDLTHVSSLENHQLDGLADVQFKGILDKILGSLIERRPSLVEKIPTEKLGSLWEQKIAANHIKPYLPQITDDRILGYLTGVEVNLIHPDLVPKVSSNLILFISRGELIKRIPNSKVKLMDPDYYKYLTDHQVRFIDLDYVSSLEDSQLDSLHPSQLKRIGNEVLGSLIKKRSPLVKKIPTKKLGELWQAKRDGCRIDDESIKDLIRERIQEITDPEILDYLEEDEVNLIHPELAKNLPERLIPFVSKSELIRRIPNGQVKDINPEYYKDLSDSQIPFIDPKHVSSLEDPQLSKLTKTQLANISNETLGSLLERRPILVKKLSTEKLGKLWQQKIAAEYIKPYLPQITAFTILRYLKEDEVNLVHISLAGRIQARLIPFVSERRLIQRMYDYQVRHINPKHYKDLKAFQVCSIDINHVSSLADPQLNYLEGFQLEAIPNEVLGSLIKRSPHLVKKLSTGKLGELWKQKIAANHIKLHLPQITDPKILDYLSGDEVNLIHMSLVRYTPVNLIPFLNRTTLIEAVPFYKVKYVSPEYYKVLSPFHACYIDLKHVLSLEDNQLIYLTREQLSQVSDETLISLLERGPILIEKVAVTRFDAIWDADLSDNLRNKLKVIISMLENQEDIQTLKGQVVNCVNPLFAQFIPPNAIPSLSESAIIRALTLTQVNRLNTAQLHRISQNQLSQMQIPTTIQKLEGNHINNLSWEQLRHVEFIQIWNHASFPQKATYVAQRVLSNKLYLLGVLLLLVGTARLVRQRFLKKPPSRPLPPKKLQATPLF